MGGATSIASLALELDTSSFRNATPVFDATGKQVESLTAKAKTLAEAYATLGKAGASAASGPAGMLNDIKVANEAAQRASVATMTSFQDQTKRIIAEYSERAEAATLAARMVSEVERNQIQEVASYRQKGAQEYRQALLVQEMDYKAYTERVKAYQKSVADAESAKYASSSAGVYAAAGIKNPTETAEQVGVLKRAQAQLREEVERGGLSWGLYSARTDQLQSKMNVLTEGNARARSEIRQLAAGAASLAFEMAGAAFGIGMVATALFSPAMIGGKYLKELEDVKLGITGVIMAMGSADGKALTFAQASQVAEEQVKKLSNEAMFLAGNTLDLAKAFQAVATQGLEAGMTIDQIRTIAVAGTAAGRALGISTTTLQRDIRDMVLGIRPNSTILSASLGITKADIDRARASADGLFGYLDGKLKGFYESAMERNKTFSGLWEQMSEMFVRAMGQSAVPVFETAKKLIQDVMDIIGKVDSKTHELTINPEFKRILDAVLDTLNNVLKVIGFVAKAAWEFHTPLLAIAAVNIGVGAWGLLAKAIDMATLRVAAYTAASANAAMASSFVGPLPAGTASAAVGALEGVAIPAAMIASRIMPYTMLAAAIAAVGSAAADNIPALQRFNSSIGDWLLAQNPVTSAPDRLKKIADGIKEVEASISAGGSTDKRGVFHVFSEADIAAQNGYLDTLKQSEKNLTSNASATANMTGNIEALDAGMKQLEGSIKAVGVAFLAASEKEEKFLSLGSNLNLAKDKLKEFEDFRAKIAAQDASPARDAQLKAIDDNIEKRKKELGISESQVSWIYKINDAQNAVNTSYGRANQINSIHLSTLKEMGKVTAALDTAKRVQGALEKPGNDIPEAKRVTELANAKAEVARQTANLTALQTKENIAIGELPSTPYEAEGKRLRELNATALEHLKTVEKERDAALSGANANELAAYSNKTLAKEIEILSGKQFQHLTSAEKAQRLQDAALTDYYNNLAVTVDLEKKRIEQQTAADNAWKNTTKSVSDQAAALVLEAEALDTSGKGAKASSAALADLAIAKQNAILTSEKHLKALTAEQESQYRGAEAYKAAAGAYKELTKLGMDADAELAKAQAESVDLVGRTEAEKIRLWEESAIKKLQIQAEIARKEADNAFNTGDMISASAANDAAIAAEQKLADKTVPIHETADLKIANFRQKEMISSQKKIEGELEKGFYKGFDDLVAGAKSATETMKGIFSSFKDFLVHSIFDAIYQTFIKQQIVIPISVAVSGGAGGTGNPLGAAQQGMSAYNLYNNVSGPGGYASQVGAGIDSMLGTTGSVSQGAMLMSQTAAFEGSQAAMLASQTAEFGAAGAALTDAAAGAGAGMAEGFLAAIPGWGWAAMAAMAVFGSGVFDHKGGPKTEYYGGQKASAFPGYDGDNGMRDTTRNASVDTLAAAGVASYAAIVARFGGISPDMKLRLAGSSDPQGTAPDNLGYAMSLNGKTYLDTKDFGRGEGEKNIPEMVNRALLAAFQATDMGPVANAIVSGLDPQTITTKMLDQTALAMTGAADLFGVSLNPLGDAMRTIASTSATLGEELKKAGYSGEISSAGLKSAVGALDLTTEAGVKSARALLALEPQIKAIETAVGAMVGITRDSLQKNFFDAIKNSPDAASAGDAFAGVLVGGVKDALLTSYTTTLSDMVFTGIMTPLLAGVMKGQTLAQIMADGTIDAAIASAEKYAKTYKAIMDDPRIKELFAGITLSAKSIGSASYVPGNYGATPTATPPASLGKLDLAQSRGAVSQYDMSSAQSDYDKAIGSLAASRNITAGQMESAILESGGLIQAALKYWSAMDAGQQHAAEIALDAKTKIISLTAQMWDEQLKKVKEIQDLLDQVKGFSKTIDTSVFDIKYNLPGANQTAMLKAQEADLWAQLDSAKGTDAESIAKQIDLSGQLKDSILKRYDLEQNALAKTSAFIQNVSDFSKQLKIGDLSPLAAVEKVVEARRQYSDLMRTLRDPLTTSAAKDIAQGKVTGAAEAALRLAQTTAITSVDYAREYAKVQADMASLGADSLTVEEQQAASLKTLTAKATATIDELHGLQSIARAATAALNALLVPEIAALGVIGKSLDALGVNMKNFTDTLPTTIANALSAVGVIKPVTGNAPTTPTAPGGGAAYTSFTARNVVDYTTANNITSPAQLYSAIVSKNANPYQVGAQFGMDANAVDAYFSGVTRLPGFATGINAGILPADQILQAHGGEEIKPAVYVDRDRAAREETNRLIARLVESNERLERKVEALQKPTEEIRAHSKRTADITQKSDAIGPAPARATL